MQNENQNSQQFLQSLIISVLQTTVNKNRKEQNKNIFDFFKSFTQKKQSSQSIQSKEIQVLQMHEYLKLFCSQKKALNQKRWEKIMQMNESLQIQQQSFRSLFMVASQANYRRFQHPGYYAKLLQSLKDYPKQMFLPIQKDVPRTLSDSHPFQESLKNILQAYAIRNSSLLYCQGMNYLVAFFLMNSVSEQESFWLLTSLIENILPDDYFRDLSTISITSQIFNDLLEHIFPQLSRQMKDIGMDCSLFLVTWYVCLFTKGFINNVSGYLLSKLILQSRHYKIGFVILKISLGVIAAVLGSDQPFRFHKQFKSFRQKLQVSVYEISLLEMKFGIEFIELNYENYLKLQNYYRQKRDQRHLKCIQRDLNQQKLTLPLCNKQFPICLQRVQIQKKIGVIQQVRILKNGYGIMQQYIQDYFTLQSFSNNKQPVLKSASSICSIYSSLNDCPISRHNHVCLQHHEQSLKKKLDTKLIFKQEQFQNEKFIILEQQGSCSFQVKSRFSKMDEKFAELSGYFVVDQNYNIAQDFGVSDDDQNIQGQKQNNVFNLQEELRLSEINDKQKSENNNISKSQSNKMFFQPNHKDIKVVDILHSQSQQKPNEKIPQKVQKNISQQKQNHNNEVNMSINNHNLSPCQSQNNSNSNNNQKNLNYRQKLIANLGKTLKRVLRIKQDQLS